MNFENDYFLLSSDTGKFDLLKTQLSGHGVVQIESRATLSVGKKMLALWPF